MAFILAGKPTSDSQRLSYTLAISASFNSVLDWARQIASSNEITLYYKRTCLILGMALSFAGTSHWHQDLKLRQCSLTQHATVLRPFVFLTWATPRDTVSKCITLTLPATHTLTFAALTMAGLDGIRTLVKSHPTIKTEGLIQLLDPKLRGWANYISGMFVQTRPSSKHQDRSTG